MIASQLRTLNIPSTPRGLKRPADDKVEPPEAKRLHPHHDGDAPSETLPDAPPVASFPVPIVNAQAFELQQTTRPDHEIETSDPMPKGRFPDDTLRHIALMVVRKEKYQAERIPAESARPPGVGETASHYARLALINQQWATAMRPLLETAWTAYLSVYVRNADPSTPSFSEDLPELCINGDSPAVFAEHVLNGVADRVANVLKDFLRRPASAGVVVKALATFLPPIQALADTHGLPKNDREALLWLPLTALNLAYMHCLHISDPERFEALVDLVLAHRASLPPDAYVQLQEDLSVLYEGDEKRLLQVKELPKGADETGIQRYTQDQQDRLDRHRRKSVNDKVYWSTVLGNPFLTRSFAHSRSILTVLSLSQIAKAWDRWASIATPKRDQHLLNSITGVLSEFALNVALLDTPSHAEFLFDLFPAGLLSKAFEKLNEKAQSTLLQRIHVNKTSLPLVTIFANRIRIPAPQRKEVLQALLKEEQTPTMREALSDLHQSIQ